MKICCVSDLHGFLPEIQQCDLLIVAGDICPNKYGLRNRSLDADYQFNWFNDIFNPWLSSVKAKSKICVWGNHDFIGEKYSIPQITNNCETVQLSNGIKVWCTPYSLRFFNWAFNCDEEDIIRYCETIPDDIDIIVSHGPPYSAGDMTSRGENVGSTKLFDAILHKDPKLVVTGHIHESYGLYQIGLTKVVNASIMDLSYFPVNKPIYLEIG